MNIESLYDNAWMLYYSRDISADVEFEEMHMSEAVEAEVRLN